MTSVMAVEVAPDLKTCKAFISVLGSEESKKSTISGLKSAEGYIRRQLAKNLNLRNTPEIRFILDESIEYGVNMSKLIDDVIEHDHLEAARKKQQTQTRNSSAEECETTVCMIFVHRETAASGQVAGRRDENNEVKEWKESKKSWMV